MGVWALFRQLVPSSSSLTAPLHCGFASDDDVALVEMPKVDGLERLRRRFLGDSDRIICLTRVFDFASGDPGPPPLTCDGIGFGFTTVARVGEGARPK